MEFNRAAGAQYSRDASGENRVHFSLINRCFSYFFSVID